MRKNYILLSFLLFFSFSFSQISTFPHSTSFESASDLSTTASDINSQWTTQTSGNSANGTDFDATVLFTRGSGMTPTNSGGNHYTGPNGASDGTYYVFMESSGTTSSDKAELAAAYDFSGRIDAQITFDFHNYRRILSI